MMKSLSLGLFFKKKGRDRCKEKYARFMNEECETSQESSQSDKGCLVLDSVMGHENQTTKYKEGNLKSVSQHLPEKTDEGER